MKKYGIVQYVGDDELQGAVNPEYVIQSAQDRMAQEMGTYLIDIYLEKRRRAELHAYEYSVEVLLLSRSEAYELFDLLTEVADSKELPHLSGRAKNLLAKDGKP